MGLPPSPMVFFQDGSLLLFVQSHYPEIAMISN